MLMMMCESHNKKSEHGQRGCLIAPPAKEVVEKSNQLTSSLVARHPVIIVLEWYLNFHWLEHLGHLVNPTMSANRMETLSIVFMLNGLNIVLMSP